MLNVVVLGVAFVALCASVGAAADDEGVPQMPFSIASQRSEVVWMKNVSHLGRITDMTEGTVNGIGYVAAFFQTSFALIRGADGLVVRMEDHEADAVFLDFVQEKLLFATRTMVECVDPEQSEVISKYTVKDGQISHIVPTGGTCEMVLFVVNANHTTSILVFHHSNQAELIHETTEDIISSGLVMDEYGMTLIVFETKGFLNGVTYSHAVHFRVPVPSNIVVGPMLFRNEFYTGDDNGVVRCYNSSGLVTRTYTFDEPTKRAIFAIDVAHDGDAIVATMGMNPATIAAFRRVDGMKLWEHPMPKETVGGLMRVRNSIFNNWEDNPELFENDTMWFYDDGGYLYQLHTPTGKWTAKVNTWPRPATPHAPAFVTMVEGQYIVFQPFGMHIVCFIGITSARPEYCYHMEGTNPTVADASAWNRWDRPVFATDEGIVAMVEAKYIPAYDYDPTKAYVAESNWAADTGSAVEAMAYDDSAICVLSGGAIFLYDPTDGKQRGDKIPVAVAYKIVQYFGVVEKDIILVTDTSVMAVPLANPTTISMYSNTAIEWAIPAFDGNEVLLFRRKDESKHEMIHFKDGKGDVIYTTEEPVVDSPVIVQGRLGKVVVFGETNHITGVQLPAGTQVFRSGFMKARLGPFRIGNHFFMGNGEGTVFRYTPDGTVEFTYKTSTVDQVRDVDVSTDGKIMVVTVGPKTVAAFDLETHEKLYETIFFTPGHYVNTISRVYASTHDDWTSHIDAWHNDTMWFYDSYADFFPFDIMKGCFIADVYTYETIMEPPRAAFAAGMARIVVQLRSSLQASFICSLTLDASLIEICTKVGDEQLNSTEWNAKTNHIVLAMGHGKITDLKMPKITPAPTTDVPHTTRPPPPSTLDPPPPEKKDHTVVVVIICIVIAGVVAAVFAFRRRITGWFTHGGYKEERGTFAVNTEEELGPKRYATI